MSVIRAHYPTCLLYLCLDMSIIQSLVTSAIKKVQNSGCIIFLFAHPPHEFLDGKNKKLIKKKLKIGGGRRENGGKSTLEENKYNFWNRQGFLLYYIIYPYCQSYNPSPAVNWSLVKVKLSCNFFDIRTKKTCDDRHV